MRVEVFSWWTAPGEAEALQSLMDLHREHYPGARIFNAATTPEVLSGGLQAKELLQQRLEAGEPPCRCARPWPSIVGALRRSPRSASLRCSARRTRADLAPTSCPRSGTALAARGRRRGGVQQRGRIGQLASARQRHPATDLTPANLHRSSAKRDGDEVCLEAAWVLQLVRALEQAEKNVLHEVVQLLVGPQAATQHTPTTAECRARSRSLRDGCPSGGPRAEPRRPRHPAEGRSGCRASPSEALEHGP